MRAKQVITPALKKSLGVKLARNVILVSLITGLLMGTFVTYRDLLATQHFFREAVQQVIKTSSNPAARAAYNVSPELAREVASGLMEYQAIISVTILDDLSNILTNKSQNPSYSPYRWIAKKGFGGLQSFEVELHIPGDPKVMVGYLQVIADPEHIAAEFVHRALSGLLIILIQSFIVAAILALVFYRLLFHPLKIMSRTLANADPDNPENTELVVPKGNLGDELYVLANSGNRLLKSIAKRVHERDIAEAELRKATESLEERIEERTKELAEQIEAAQAASKAKHEFLATMSHEIRTPMTGVMGIADMLLDETIKPETREKVVLIKEETQSLLCIINDILDLSKIDAGKLKFENIDYHLRYELDKTIKIAKRYARGKPLHIICNVSENVPNDLHGDPTRLRQVLINLLGNAVKFTEKGHVSLEAHRETSSNSQAWLVLSVSDTGIGIPADRVDELFNEFTQADASISRRYEGTGLGLAISKRLIEHMTGTINLTSIEGEGSSFEVRLPLIEAKGEMEAETVLEPVIDYETVRPLHILAVDDNMLNRRIIESILVKFGHKITFAHNGLEAVEQLSACILENGKGAIKSDLASPIRPDLVLMDIRMPEMSGPEATQKIRALDGDIANIPIIALSADVIEDHVQEYYEVGMNSFVPKPIDYITLLGEINAVMKQEIHRPILKSQTVENISKIQQKA